MLKKIKNYFKIVDMQTKISHINITIKTEIILNEENISFHFVQNKEHFCIVDNEKYLIKHLFKLKNLNNFGYKLIYHTLPIVIDKVYHLVTKDKMLLKEEEILKELKLLKTQLKLDIFDIKNENGKDVIFVDEKILSLKEMKELRKNIRKDYYYLSQLLKEKETKKEKEFYQKFCLN